MPTSTTVDTNNSNSQGAYDHLFEMGDRVEENKGKGVEAILLEVAARDREVQTQRKVVHIQTKNQRIDEHAEASNAKVDVHRRTSSTIVGSFEVAASILSACLGGNLTPPGGIFSALATACGKTSAHQERAASADLEKHNHFYQRIGALASDHTQHAQGADRGYEESTNAISRVMQNMQRLAELMFGAQ